MAFLSRCSRERASRRAPEAPDTSVYTRSLQPLGQIVRGVVLDRLDGARRSGQAAGQDLVVWRNLRWISSEALR